MTAWQLTEFLGETEEALLEPVLTAPAKRRLSRPIRTAILLAAVIALLALLGVAAKEAGLLSGLFPEKFETIEDYVNHMTVSVENEGLRLTLHEAVTDRYTLVLVYSVERLDGGSMEEGWAPDMLICPLKEDGYPARSVSGIWNMPLDTGEKNPAKRTYVYSVNGLNGLGRITFRLFGLIQNETRERFSPGYLEAETELKPCLTKVARRQGGVEIKKLYTNIVLSPFGLRAEVLTNLAGMTPENAPEPEKWSLNKTFRGSLDFVFNEGEEQELFYDVGLLADPYCQGVYVLNVAFRQPTDIRGVRAVRIDGVEYPLETGSLLPQRMGLMDISASPLESARAWVYGDHEPAHPDLTGEGAETTLSLDGVWTDGYTTELMLSSRGGSGGTAASSAGLTVNLGGGFSFEALNAAGEPVAVGVRSGGAAEGLLPFAAECTEKAETLIIRCEDAELTVPLNMKQLKKLPQITPQEPSKGYIPDPERNAETRQRMFDSLFAGYTPVEVNRTADNGVYRITMEYLAHRGGGGSGDLRAWAVCSALEGDYDPLLDRNGLPFACYVLSGGQELQVNGGAGGGGTYDKETGVQIYRLNIEYSGDFDRVDALRLVWTPPAGDRITLDLERTF